jgi:hypothetical protein
MLLSRKIKLSYLVLIVFSFACSTELMAQDQDEVQAPKARDRGSKKIVLFSCFHQGNLKPTVSTYNRIGIFLQNDPDIKKLLSGQNYKLDILLENEIDKSASCQYQMICKNHPHDFHIHGEITPSDNIYLAINLHFDHPNDLTPNPLTVYAKAKFNRHTDTYDDSTCSSEIAAYFKNKNNENKIKEWLNASQTNAQE